MVTSCDRGSARQPERAAGHRARRALALDMLKWGEGHVAIGRLNLFRNVSGPSIAHDRSIVWRGGFEPVRSCPSVRRAICWSPCFGRSFRARERVHETSARHVVRRSSSRPRRSTRPRSDEGAPSARMKDRRVPTGPGDVRSGAAVGSGRDRSRSASAWRTWARALLLTPCAPATCLSVPRMSPALPTFERVESGPARLVGESSSRRPRQVARLDLLEVDDVHGPTAGLDGVELDRLDDELGPWQQDELAFAVVVVRGGSKISGIAGVVAHDHAHGLISDGTQWRCRRRTPARRDPCTWCW